MLLDHAARRGGFLRMTVLVALTCENAAATAAPQQPSELPRPAASSKAPKRVDPIVVSSGPDGIMIASEDSQALDEFSQLLTTLARDLTSDHEELTIFYLKHAKAATVAGLLEEISIQQGTTVRITADARLNALIVQANGTVADTIEEILRILDEKQAPREVSAQAPPRFIPVRNTRAEEVAEVIREVFQDRLTTGSARENPQASGGFPGPAQGPGTQSQGSGPLMTMLRGGMGQQGGAQRGGSRRFAEDVHCR